MQSRKPTQAEIEKAELEKGVRDSITQLYVDLSVDLTANADVYMGVKTTPAKRAYLYQVQQDIKLKLIELQQREVDIITKAANESGENSLLAINRMMLKAGLDMNGSYKNLVEESVRNVLQGKVYKKDWNLQRAIKRDINQTSRDMNLIIKWGLDENKNIGEILQDLKAYANPKEKSRFNYTGKHKVAAYAQRIARTVIQHVYQLVTRGATKNNPYVLAFRWCSVGGPTTCEICSERDGMLFPVGIEPLDHPNGLCWLEPVTMPLDEFSKKVSRWTEGQYNEIEYYIRDAFGYNNKKAAKGNVAAHYMQRQY